MNKGRIIFLNGVTSSGKTSIVEALQERDDVFFYVVANDLFQEMVGEKFLRENYWKYLSEVIIMMYHTAKLYSDMGKHVLIDGILVEREEIKPHYEQMLNILKDNPLDIVEVYCPLDICRERNIARGDRYENQSQEQFELMAENIQYRMRVDTSVHTATECAEEIVRMLFGKYDKCIELWDDIFSKKESVLPKKKETGNVEFDKGLAWLTDNALSVLDFGCGNGTILFLCNKYGTKTHIGIDLSSQAIKSAIEKSKMVENGDFQFLCGGIEALKRIPDESMDSAILSNIIDNLYPEDAIDVLEEIKRILKKNGKLLVKLNPFITDEQIEEYGIKTISGNLLDDGMLLWNNTNEEWEDILGARYSISSYVEIYYEEYEQRNRMYLLIN